MSNDEEGLRKEWVAALEDSLRAFGDLVVDQAVVAAWSDASCLEGYTVGGIAGHVLSLAIGLQMRLDAAPGDLDVIPYQDWYRTAVVPTDAGAIHTGLIEIGEKLASQGPESLRAEIIATGASLGGRLLTALPERTIPLASLPGAGVRLDDFLRTRFVEIVVHADDIATSAAIGIPPFPVVAWVLAESVVAETSGVVGGGSEYVLQTCRPDRFPPSPAVGPA